MQTKIVPAFIRKQAAKFVTGGAGLMSSVSAFADTTVAETAITAAKTDALTVGYAVVAAVAGLVVIGLIISMIRKL
ncbi:MAG: hypothetical protein RLZZ298_2981 [Pseudomonadota bacterium]|jgi:hypothetical protein